MRHPPTEEGRIIIMLDAGTSRLNHNGSLHWLNATKLAGAKVSPTVHVIILFDHVMGYIIILVFSAESPVH